jgi:protein disulfide-isomerase
MMIQRGSANAARLDWKVSALYKLAIFLLIACSSAIAADKQPYDESADAKAEVRKALTEASLAKVPVLIIFGANWCADCRALDNALKSSRNAELLANSFKLVKVNVGNFDKNTDLVNAYGNPIKKGIPAAVILSPANKVLYSTKSGELANARTMSETGIYDFFSKACDKAK